MIKLSAVLMTVNEAAFYFRVSPKTVRTWISRYEIERAPGSTDQVSHYPLDVLVEAEFRARSTPGGRPRKASPIGLTGPGS